MPYKDKEKQKACWSRYQKSEKSKATKKAWASRTPEKQAEYRRRHKERMSAEPERYKIYFRNRHILTKYGITGEQFERMVEDQEGKCAICGRLPNGTNHVEQRLLIDHDHKSGKVRGLLCNNCNSGMGILGDSEEHLLAALAYLKKHAAKED